MKISMEWLQEHIDLPDTLARLREDLTMAGLVVESVTEMHGTRVLEIEITANRPDCLSYIGIAREIAALYGKPIRHAPITRKLRLEHERIPFGIEIRDPDLCPRYIGMVFDGIRVAPSPPWMQRRLEASGMRPVNNIVDITNYVLLERGHPLHAFDFDRLHEGQIVVSRALPGQNIVTLDGVARELDAEMLLINDGAVPVALAGVMGGANSEIHGQTQRLLLECAYFKPASIRRTSKKLGLATEASYRFERGADWDGLVAAVARVCHLLKELAGARIAGSMQDAYPFPIAPVTIELKRTHAESLLGVHLSSSFIQSALKRLNFITERTGRGEWRVQCPTYRADMELEADLIEEVGRLYGYQNIPATVPAGRSHGRPSALSPYEGEARRILLGLGYSEVVNLSFAGDPEWRRYPFPEGEAVAIRNPLTEDTQFLRGLLAPGLVRTARHNFHHGNRQLLAFEIGKIFRRDSAGEFIEQNALGILGTGGHAGTNWHHAANGYDFYNLKGVVTALLQGLRCESFEIVPDAHASWLNPADAASIMIAGRCQGVLGSLHGNLVEEFKLKQPVFLAEIALQNLIPHVFTAVRFQPLARYPAVERDISIVVPRDAEYGSLCRGIRALGIPELAGVELMDVYEGDPIPAGKTGLTLRLTFLDRQMTLTVDRVQGFRDNIVAYLCDHFSAELR